MNIKLKRIFDEIFDRNDKNINHYSDLGAADHLELCHAYFFSLSDLDKATMISEINPYLISATFDVVKNSFMPEKCNYKDLGKAIIAALATRLNSDLEDLFLDAEEQYRMEAIESIGHREFDSEIDCEATYTGGVH